MKPEETLAAVLRDKDATDAEKSAAAAELAHLRHQNTAPRTRKRSAAKAARALWDKMTPEQRSKEMRRRRRLGIKRRKARALAGEES
jgi:hypothetical protein